MARQPTYLRIGRKKWKQVEMEWTCYSRGYKKVFQLATAFCNCNNIFPFLWRSGILILISSRKKWKKFEMEWTRYSVGYKKVFQLVTAFCYRNKKFPFLAEVGYLIPISSSSDSSFVILFVSKCSWHEIYLGQSDLIQLPQKNIKECCWHAQW